MPGGMEITELVSEQRQLAARDAVLLAPRIMNLDDSVPLSKPQLPSL